ncbi:MAG: TadE/TadG family type IV pilus assembly protein [Marinobacter sp.]|uniref:TadE/TadG family type IV pilus assembly protein n=1 Tax=Marinobacter sp. TaxID=50741 RepID=UPI00299D4717|nr:TadE/TadG family type IV pilus assembly protein [Marinobacter sp.]MDX1635440.1 TadE/TadG family type IV pilus assembly protein [Marinobacter sp.]
MKKSKGAVALEFLFLFPFVVAMLYAAATYGLLFFGKYEMQGVVDQAASSALRVDRNRVHEDALGEQVTTTATAVLTEGAGRLSPAFREAIESSGCVLSTVQGLELLRCSMTLNNTEAPVIPQMSFGLLGLFPPLPERLSVEASVAF